MQVLASASVLGANFGIVRAWNSTEGYWQVTLNDGSEVSIKSDAVELVRTDCALATGLMVKIEGMMQGSELEGQLGVLQGREGLSRWHVKMLDGCFYTLARNNLLVATQGRPMTKMLYY